MNKKLFLGMFAAAGMLFATSCSNDELDVVQSGNEAQVTFSLGLEGGIATRAISDGQSADVLMYAVFDKEGERINTIQKVSKTGVTFPTTENITLAKGQTYKVAFWAQDEDCKAYTVSDDMKVTVDYETNNTSNNDETRDAFFKTVEFTVTGSTSIDVELKRPFAQINVGVTKADWDAAVASGITVAQSSVVIKNAATELNLLDGTVSGETEVSYELANIPSDPAILQVDTDGDGIKEDYNWLSMSYILPSAAPTGYEKAALENVAFVFASNGEPIEFNQGLNNVPVQRNWRTNIVGKILTGDITFNIVIDEEFEGDHNVMLPYATIGDVVYKSFAEAMAAVQDGETITLEGETTIDGVADGNLFTIDGKSITIDLNGYGFVATVPDVTKNSSIFYVAKNSGLTIVGEGNVKVTTNKAPNVLAAFINNDGGTVNLKGGNWTMTALEYPDALIPTFVDNNSNVNSATLNIYDGTYTFHRNLFRNFANAAGHNNYATVATINIYGGTFNGRESDAGAIWNQKPSATTPNGAGIINVMGGTFNNVNISDDFSGVVYVNNQEELNNALANVNTHTVMLGAGKYVPSLYNNDIPARKSLTIIGSEGTQFAYTGSNYAGQLALAGFENFTIRNCEILKRENVKDWGMVVFGSSNNPNGVYTIENCTFNGVGTQGIYINEQASGATYNILNCTFDGDFGTEGAITIQTNKDVNHTVNVKGCTFNNIPDTSHRIFLAKVSTGFYYGWTLNTESKAYSAYDLAMLVAMNYTEIDLADGEYNVESCGGKTLTLNGSKNAIIKVYNEGEDGCDYGFDGSTVTFNGLTINTTSNTGNYKGYARMKATFNGCNFEGAYCSNQDQNFNNCTFDFKNGYFWTWGATTLNFDGCTFNGNSKTILAHGGNSTTINIKDCTFAATEKGYTGSGDNTAVVEMDPTGSNTYTINFTGTNTKTDSYAGWTRVKDDSTGHTITGVE